MKKLLKFAGISLSLMLIVFLSILFYINSQDLPKYETQVIDYPVFSTPESIARGKKLASMLCASCHRNPETGKLTGKEMLDAPKEFGRIFSANITQDPEYGIGRYTDSEIMYLLRTGIKRDGSYAPPYMAKLPKMADEDIRAIISFLRSEDPMVSADATPDSPCEPSLLTKILCKVAFKPLPLPEKTILLPDSADILATGEYLAINLECFSCHSADFTTNDFLEPSKSVGFFGGGNKPLNMDGHVMPTPNLTPDKETGIGLWTEEQFIQALKYGKIENQPALRFPMLPYALLTDEEASAIFHYLQTIPPIQNKVERAVLN